MRSLPQPVIIGVHEFKTADEIFGFLRRRKWVFGLTLNQTPVVVRWPETDNAKVIFEVRSAATGELTGTYMVYEVLDPDVYEVVDPPCSPSPDTQW